MLARVERFEVKESRANSRLHHDCERSSLAIVVRRALTTGSTLGQPSNDTIRSAAASMIHSQHCSPKAWQHFHGDPRPICSRGRRENPPKSMPRTTARHALDPGACAGAAGTPNHRFCIARVPRRPELRVPDSLVDLSSGLRRQNGRARAIFHRFRSTREDESNVVPPI